MTKLKRLPTTSIPMLVVASLAVGALALGCSDDKSENSSSTVSAESLSAGQCEAQSLDGDVASCVDSYATCIAAANADKTACAATLASCIPEDVEDDTDGGHHHHHHEHHRRGGDGHCVRADWASVKACHDQVLTCVAGADGGTTAVDTCREAGRDCVKTAYAAAFTVACASITKECGTSTSEHCEKARARCASGADTDAGTDACTE